MASATRVLVVGGSGFVGFRLVQTVLQQRPEWHVTVLNRGSKYWNNDFDNFSHRSQFEHVICDRHDAPKLREALLSRTFDVIVDFCAYEPRDVQTLFQALSPTSAESAHYVLISSDSVYEVSSIVKQQSEEWRVEADAQRPDSEEMRKILRKKDKYGDNKLRCEEWLRANKRRFTALRLPDVFGPRDDTDRHWSYQLLVKLAISGRRVHITETERQRKLSFVFSGDVVQAILLSIEQQDKALGKSFNLGTDSTYTIEEYLRAIGKVIGAQKHLKFKEVEDNPFQYLPSVTERTGVISTQLIQRELGWKPTAFVDAIQETCTWFENAWHLYPMDVPHDEDLSREEWSILQGLYRKDAKDEL